MEKRDKDFDDTDAGDVRDISRSVPVGDSQIGSRKLADSMPTKTTTHSTAKLGTSLPFLAGMLDVGMSEKELDQLSAKLTAAGFSNPYQTAMELRYGLAEKMREFLPDTVQQNKLIALYQQAYVKSLPHGVKPRY